MKKTLLETLCGVLCVLFAVSVFELGWTLYRCTSIGNVNSRSFITVKSGSVSPAPSALTYKGSVYRAFSSSPASSKPKLLSYKPVRAIGAARSNDDVNKAFYVYSIRHISPQTAVVYQMNQKASQVYVNEEYLWPYQTGNIVFFSILSGIFGLGTAACALLLCRLHRHPEKSPVKR